MSKSARDYRVTFGYNAVDGVYYVPGRPHRGNDRPTPAWTPVVIGSTTIGYTGATGLVSGPHLHTQAGTDKYCQNTINPTHYDFKGGTVVHTGWANQWGNHIIMKVGNRYICYAHLAKLSVKIGQVIEESGGGETVDKTDLTAIYELGPLNRKRGRGEGEDVYLGKSAAFVLRDHAKSAEAKRKASQRANEIKDIKAKLTAMTKDRDAWKAKAGTGGAADPETVEAASKWNQLKKLFGLK